MTPIFLPSPLSSSSRFISHSVQPPNPAHVSTIVWPLELKADDDEVWCCPWPAGLRFKANIDAASLLATSLSACALAGDHNGDHDGPPDSVACRLSPAAAAFKIKPALDADLKLGLLDDLLSLLLLSLLLPMSCELIYSLAALSRRPIACKQQASLDTPSKLASPTPMQDSEVAPLSLAEFTLGFCASLSSPGCYPFARRPETTWSRLQSAS